MLMYERNSVMNYISFASSWEGRGRCPFDCLIKHLSPLFHLMLAKEILGT